MAKQMVEHYGVRGKLYAILLKRKNGTEFFAIGNDSPAVATYSWAKAKGTLLNLHEHGFRGRVVRVRMTLETLPPQKRRK